MQSKPFDAELSGAVLLICSELLPNGFDLAEEGAPETFEALCEHVGRSAGRFLIYSGASDHTIWGAPEVNHAFRAWHDYHHYHARLPFTPEGEARTCELQCADLIARYGDNAKTRQWCKLLRAEINGQLEYAAHHSGAFPVNQRDFIVHYLCCASAAIRSDF